MTPCRTLKRALPKNLLRVPLKPFLPLQQSAQNSLKIHCAFSLPLLVGQLWVQSSRQATQVAIRAPKTGPREVLYLVHRAFYCKDLGFQVYRLPLQGLKGAPFCCCPLRRGSFGAEVFQRPSFQPRRDFTQVEGLL